MHSASPSDHPARSAWDHNARVGLILFFFYFLLYAGFIALSAFFRSVLEKPVLMGVNLAIIYGLFLIVAAFALALLYMALCKPEPAAPSEVDLTEGEIAGKADAEGGF